MPIKVTPEEPAIAKDSVVYRLDGRKCSTLRDFYIEISNVMNFPDFGHNPDAFIDVLEDYSDYAKKKGQVVIIVNHAQFFLENEIYKYRMIEDIVLAFKRASRYWSSEDPRESKSSRMDVFFIVDETNDEAAFFKTRLQQITEKPAS